ncbi:MAG: sialate O-acetylesterase [Ferruginibacter sp.]
MDKTMKYISSCACATMLIFIAPVLAKAQLRLPSVISSGMVLQQKDSVNLWGWSNPGEKIFVKSGWNNHIDSTVASNGAKWKLKISTPVAGGPYEIRINTGDTITLTDVMIGEVWVCSGQSNMEMNYTWGEKDIAGELSNAYNRNIRFFQVPKTTADYPQDDVKAHWAICDSNTIKNFSAVGYFFGKKLNQSLNIPVALIHASWGGTPAETWTPSGLIEKDTAMMTAAKKLHTVPWWPIRPSIAFNGMIAPVTNFTIAGSIWYQGESNAGTSNTYSKLFTTMIEGWRNAWQRKFPFYYVQIAPFNYGDNLNGALLQEAQTLSMSHPNVGMVVTTDLIDSVTNIHPSKKQEVGNRLANWALAETYKQNNIVYKSPIFVKAEKKANQLILSFDNVPTGLFSKEKMIKGFYVSDEKNEWHPAEAKLEKNKIIVLSKEVKDPVYVRYGFSNTIIGNVFSSEGLPLIPFRTDHFE